MFISSCFEVRDKLIWPFLEYWINVMIYINVAIVPWYWNHCNYHAFHAFVIQYCYSHANKAHCCCCCCWFTYLMLEVGVSLFDSYLVWWIQPSHLSSVAFIRIKSSQRWHKIMNYGCLRENYYWSIQVKTSLATDDIFSPLEAM